MDFANSPEVRIHTESVEFSMGSLSLILDWIPQKRASYNVSTVPETTVNFISRTSIHLILLYFTEYNVSISAMLCGQNTASTFVKLHYGEPHNNLACEVNI